MVKVMVVEDETLIRFALADELVAAGHVVIECANVLEAVAALSRHDDIHAVVTDVDMPGGLTGLDLARLIAQTRRQVPVWITSGRKIETSGVDKGVSYRAKPYDMTALVREISRRTELGSIPPCRTSVAGQSGRVLAGRRRGQ